MRTVELIDPYHQKLANPPKGGDAKPWVYRPSPEGQWQPGCL